MNSSGISYGTMRGIIFDSRNLMWFVNAHWIGGALFCYDTTNNVVKKYDTFVNQDGTNVEITYVRCVAEDKDGNIWVGTNEGPLELTSSEIESGGTTFTQVKIPRNDGTTYADYLLNGIDISCITIDGANRKWFGTLYNGAFLISTDNMEIATKIAKNIRHINGGLRYVKAMGVELKERNITQVSINMTDYTRTALYRAFELVRIEARRYGVTIVGSEIIGLVPMEALIDTASYYLGLENFTMQQVLEARIMV